MAGERKVLVAGASGAIGRRLCHMLVADGWTVVGTTRRVEKRAMLRAMDVEPVVVDVFDPALLCDVVRKLAPAVVMHQLTDLPPALDPARMAEARVRNARIRAEGTRNLVAAAAAAGVKRMVAQSIAFAYAPGPKPWREEAPLGLDDPDLGETARGAESLEQQILSAPFEGLVLRYGRLYGPGTGFDTRQGSSPVHVDAAADAARRAATQGESGVYNIAEDDGVVCSRKAAEGLGWTAEFRLAESSR